MVIDTFVIKLIAEHGQSQCLLMGCTGRLNEPSDMAKKARSRPLYSAGASAAGLLAAMPMTRL